MQRSVTQTANYVALAGLIVPVLKLFGLELAETDVATLISAGLILGGIVTSLVNRYQKGDMVGLIHKR